VISSRCFFALLPLLAFGCGDRPVAAPVKPDVARETLKTTLDAWKAGRPIETLVNDKPPVVAQDFDWMAGTKLDAYEVLNEGVAQDANLKVAVRLTLHGKGIKTVNYIVGTDIKLTVFRSLE
jgi:hypothetical protein